MTQDNYTGVQGAVTYAGSPLAVSEFSFTVTRGLASHARSGKWSDLNKPGKVSVTGKITRIQTNATLIAAALTGTPTTGSVETLKDHVAVTADGATAMDDTSIATASRIRATVETSAITTGGHLDFVGEDVNGNRVVESVDVGTIGIGEYVTTRGTFLKLYYVYVTDIRSSGNGTLVIASIAGDSTANVGEPKFFTLVGYVTDGGNNITVTLTNCFFTGSKFSFTDASQMLSDDLPFAVTDPDADVVVSGVDA